MWYIFAAPFIIAICITVIGMGTYFLINEFGVDRGLFLYNFSSPPVIVMSLAIFILFKKIGAEYSEAILKYDRIIKKTSGAVFGIYLSHMLFIGLLHNLGISSSNFLPIFSIPLLAILVFAISYSFTLILQKTPLLRLTVP